MIAAKRALSISLVVVRCDDTIQTLRLGAATGIESNFDRDHQRPDVASRPRHSKNLDMLGREALYHRNSK